MLTNRDILVIGDILTIVRNKYKRNNQPIPSAIEMAIKNFELAYNQELSWDIEEL